MNNETDFKPCEESLYSVVVVTELRCDRGRVRYARLTAAPAGHGGEGGGREGRRQKSRAWQKLCVSLSVPSN